MKQIYGKLGGQLGVGLCLLGLLLVFLGWNGAASRNFVPAQFPYLISGGVTGLCLVVIGTGMIVVQNQRADRAALQASIERLAEALERAGLASRNGGRRRATPEGMVVAGRSSYHLPQCHLVEGRDEADELTPDEAAARGLDPCRICNPPAGRVVEPAPVVPDDVYAPDEPRAERQEEAEREPEPPRRRRLRAR